MITNSANQPFSSPGALNFTVTVPSGSPSVNVYGSYDLSNLLATVAAGTSTTVYGIQGTIWCSSAGQSSCSIVANIDPRFQVNGVTVIAMPDANVTLTIAQAEAAVIELGGSTPTATRTLFINATQVGQTYAIINATPVAIVISNATGNTFTIPQGSNAFVAWDGTNVVGQLFSQTNYTSVTLTTSLTLTQAQYTSKILNFAGTPGAPCTITFPAVAGYAWDVANNSGQTLTLTTSGQGSPPTLATAKKARYYCDGASVFQLTAAN